MVGIWIACHIFSLSLISISFILYSANLIQFTQVPKTNLLGSYHIRHLSELPHQQQHIWLFILLSSNLEVVLSDFTILDLQLPKVQ